MENPQKKIHIDEDRLSNLPGDVIERLLDLLTVPDAARTCVLSSKWRYVWVNHPSLVLDDRCFWSDRHLSKSMEKVNDNRDIVFAKIVSSILLSHFGHIREFVMNIWNLEVCYKDIDFWLSYLCRKSLKVLHFRDSVEADDIHQYEVPSFVFVKSERTQLSLSFCSVRNAIGCFKTIQSMILEKVHIKSSIILTTPLLTSLSMEECYKHDPDVVFDISAPKLASLTLNDNLFLNLQPFFTCTDIEYVFLSQAEEDSLKCDGKHLLDLLALWPKVSVLVVDGYYFEELATGNIPANVHIPPLNLRRFALRDVNLDCKKIAWILHVLKNSPLLHTFKIQFGKEVVNENDEPSIMDFTMCQLRTVKMKGFTASRNEVIFINILLKCAPFLEKMFVEEDRGNDQLDPYKILKELFLLQSKYRNAKIIFAPRDV